MWIAISVPLMLLGCLIAIVPVLYGSIRDARTQSEEATVTASAEAKTQTPRSLLEVICPPCGTALHGEDLEGVLRKVGDHAWRHHGVPPSGHEPAYVTARPS